MGRSVRFLTLSAVFLLCSDVAFGQDAPAEITTPRENLSRITDRDISAEGDPRRCDIRLVGKIGPGTAKALKAVIGTEEQINEFNEHATTLCLDSTGGLVTEALEIARFIVKQRSQAITTVVQDDAVCQSACALIFLAGRERSRLGPSIGRYLHPRGRLMFHPTYLRPNSDESIERYLKGERTRDQVLAQFYASGLNDVREIMSMYGDTTWFADYVKKPFASASLFLEVFSQAKEEWLCMDTVDKLGRWGIRLVGYDKAQLPAQRYYNVCRNAYIWGHDERAAENWRPNDGGRATRVGTRKAIAGRNADLDDGFDKRYTVEVDFAIKGQKCVIEEKNRRSHVDFKVYIINSDGGLVSGIYETDDVGFFPPSTPIAVLGKPVAASAKQSRLQRANSAFPRFAKQEERAAACELKSLRIDNVDGCEATCAENRECVAYSYRNSTKTCSLKHTSSALRFDPLWVTGIRPGFKIPPDSIKPFTMDYDPFVTAGVAVLIGRELDSSSKRSLDECIDSCHREQECRGVTFTAEKSLCKRFRSVDKISTSDADRPRDNDGNLESTETAIKLQK